MKIYYEDGSIVNPFGYTIKEVNQNRNISYASKAVYSYLASFAGSKYKCWPPQNLICLDLGMSRPTLSKCLHELEANNIIRIEKNTAEVKGQFSNNIYHLLIKVEDD